MANTRRHRRELAYEMAKLRVLQRSVDQTTNHAKNRALATRISEQAEICLHLLDEYQLSVPGRMWSDAERRCQPLREDLKRTGRHFRGASGEMELRAGEQLWGRSWWGPPDPASPGDEALDRYGGGDTEPAVTFPERHIFETPADTVRLVEVLLSGLEFDPDPRLLPDDPAQMMTLVSIVVGKPEDWGGEVFCGALCTPEWLAKESESARLMPGAGLLIVRPEDFDERRVRREIERFLARIHEATWDDAVRRIEEWFPYRGFDGFAL